MQAHGSIYIAAAHSRNKRAAVPSLSFARQRPAKVACVQSYIHLLATSFAACVEIAI
jgi:hypothetical protein